MTPYDVIIGASGQDGTILSDIYAKMNRKVILVSRSVPKNLSKHALFFCVDLKQDTKLIDLLKQYPINNVYYLAAEHDTQTQFAKLNDYNAKLINFVVPKRVLTTLSEYQPQAKFFYASSKLVFQKLDGNYSDLNPRRFDNAYSMWKNEFEIFVDGLSKSIKLISIFWLSNHDSIYRKDQFLLPRIAKYLAHQIFHNDKRSHSELKVENDWGDAHEFMKIIYEFMTGTEKSGLHKQFLSNFNVCNVDQIMNEILNHGCSYETYLNSYKPSYNLTQYTCKDDLGLHATICTRSVIWSLVKHQLSLLKQ